VTDEEPPEGFDDDPNNVVAFRHPDTGQPTVVPRELALQESRHYKAYCDYLTGVPWEIIAERYEYPDARAAQYDIGRYVEGARSLYNSFTKHQAKALAMSRLEWLLSTAAEGAGRGSVPHINTARQLVQDMIKLDKLDELEDDPAGKGPQTVVVGGSEDEYTKSLEQAARD
jgi:hypothetical protein